MEIVDVHTLDVKNEEEFLLIQNRLAKYIDLDNKLDIKDIKLCAGVDLAYWEKDDLQYGVCSIIVLDYETKRVLEKVHSYGKINTQYVAGFLAFRELPLVVKTAKKLSLEPDVFLFDGNGYLHFNHMGIATHASFFLDKPTIGVAKSYLKVKEHDFIMPENTEGSYTDIIIEGDTYGRVLRTRRDVKPIFISCGNYIGLEATTQIVNELINKRESRLPIPVRLADIETYKLRRELSE